MKRLLPSLKEKKRYLAFETISESKITDSDIKNAVKESALKFMGELNYGKAEIKMIKNNIIKVNSKFVNHLKTSLMLIKDINNKKITFKTKKVSGILKKLKEAE